MGKTGFNRRSFLGAGGATLAFPMLSSGVFAAGSVDIRAVWWGGDERGRRTNAAIKAFMNANPGISVEAETMGWDDYWARLATQVAGGNAPDFIQMDYRYMAEYARRGAIRPLDDYLGNELQIEDFGAANLESCSVDGKLYGGNVGVNSFGVLLDPTAWENAGVEAPDFGTSYEDFAAKCADFAAAGPDGKFAATADGSGSESLFEGWLRGKGKALYTADGELAYGADDAAEWFAYWAEMRASGACLRPDIQALYKNTIETSPLVNGYAATDFAFSNQFVGFQKLMETELAIVGEPVVTDGQPSHYLKPSQMFSIAASSDYPAETAMLINFLIRDPAGTRILGVERGIPASPEIRDMLMPELDAPSRKAVEFISKLTPYVGSLPPAPPKGAGELNAVLIKVSQEVAFGAKSAREGGAKLVDEAMSVLERG